MFKPPFKPGDIVKLINTDYHTKCNLSTRLKVIRIDSLNEFFEWVLYKHDGNFDGPSVNSELPCREWILAEPSGLAKFIALQEALQAKAQEEIKC